MCEPVLFAEFVLPLLISFLADDDSDQFNCCNTSCRRYTKPYYICRPASVDTQYRDRLVGGDRD